MRRISSLPSSRACARRIATNPDLPASPSLFFSLVLQNVAEAIEQLHWVPSSVAWWGERWCWVASFCWLFSRLAESRPKTMQNLPALLRLAADRRHTPNLLSSPPSLNPIRSGAPPLFRIPSQGEGKYSPTDPYRSRGAPGNNGAPICYSSRQADLNHVLDMIPKTTCCTTVGWFTPPEGVCFPHQPKSRSLVTYPSKGK